MKFKPHSRFALPCCIFSKQMLGVFCNFPKQNTPDFYIFPKIFVEELLVWSTPLYDKKCFNCRNLLNNHTFRTIANILIDTQSRFPANFIRSFCDFQSNYSLPEASIHELYSTLIGGIKHIISSQINTFISFARKIVSSLFDVFSWYIEYYKYFYCTLLQEGRPIKSPTFFYKRKIRIASICTAKELQL